MYPHVWFGVGLLCSLRNIILWDVCVLLLHAGLHLQQWVKAEPQGWHGECGPGMHVDIRDIIPRHGDIMEGGPFFKESAPIPRGDAPLF